MELLRDKLNHNVLVVSVGPSTSKMVENFQIKVDVVPNNYRMGAMVKELADFIVSND